MLVPQGLRDIGPKQGRLFGRGSRLAEGLEDGIDFLLGEPRPPQLLVALIEEDCEPAEGPLGLTAKGLALLAAGGKEGEELLVQLE
jgi:hypothetical protein